MAAPNIDAAAYRALIRHLFLLPDLPQENNDKPFTLDLPKLLEYALQNCEGLFPEDCVRQLRQCRKSIANFVGLRAKTDNATEPDIIKTNEEALFKLLKKNTARTFLPTLVSSPNVANSFSAATPLYLPHHNAGVIIRWGLNDRRIEAFQLSPRVQAITATTGRLRRKFPEINCTIQEETADDEQFTRVIAETFAEMDKGKVARLRPTRSIGGKKSEDHFDAILPNHIFDVLFPFLATEKSKNKDMPADASIMKQTRDFVLYVDKVNTAIRRSPVWLLLKVVMQQELRVKKKLNDHTLYKQFMVYFFALLLDGACARDFDSDTLHCMRRKIGYRTWKLRGKADGLWMETVANAVKRSNDVLDVRWQEIVRLDQGLKPAEMSQFLADATNCHVKHSHLDQFLERVRQQPPKNKDVVPEPKSDITSWPPGKLPNISQLGKVISAANIYNLVKVEQWVEDWLSDFMRTHAIDASTCSDLKSFAMAYFKRASVAYKNRPDHISIMYLTLLELWVQCDVSAVAANPLLTEYEPLGVDSICWDSLLLRTKRDMDRLCSAQNYIRERSDKKLNMIEQYGKADCFASRFARASESHMRLVASIESGLAKKEQEISAELQKLIAEREGHLKCHESMICDPTKCSLGTGQLPCKRCQHLIIAREMTIPPYQKTLPDDEDLAYAVVFELRLPADFSAWRDFCFFLRLDVAGHENPEPVFHFQTYQKSHELFVPYFASSALESQSRICLAAAPSKSDKVPVPIRKDLELSDLCRPHPMKWKLFDFGQKKFIKEIEKGYLFEETCHIKLDGRNDMLQMVFSARDTDTADAPTTPNDLIAMRLEAESTSMLKHNEELGSLYLCMHVMWPKLLRELRETSVDWTAPETFLLTLQMALKAGPVGNRGQLRQRHAQISSKSFAEKMLEEISRLLGIYKASYSGRAALAVFCTIAIKIICERPDSGHAKAKKILKTIRDTCFGWLRQVRLSGTDVASDLFQVQLEVALVCVYTFNLENRPLREALTSGTGAEQFVFASTIIQEGKSRIATQFQKTLHSAWLRLAVNASQMLCTQVRNGQTGSVASGLEFSLGKSLDLTPDHDKFSHVSGPWIKTFTKSPSYPEKATKTIHLNLMTGEILIDGKSPRQLSEKYLSHADFQALFSSETPAVTPNSHPMYKYRFRHAFKGYKIEVGLEPKNEYQDADEIKCDLHVRATKGSAVYVLVPRYILSQSFPFPSEYLDEYFHWHHVTDKEYQIDFHPRQSPWPSDSIAWHLSLLHRGWLLKQHERDRAMVPDTVPHYETLSMIFQHFMSEKDFAVVLNKEKNILEVRLGTLGLNFFVEHGSASIRSVEFEGMCIDHEYSPSTLIGLLPKLVLRHHRDQTGRMLLVLDGDEYCVRRDPHVQVDVEITKHTALQVYTIDEDLRQLKSNQTWRSKAWLAYLSALTSSCLPDPFTSHTGQETALDILTSGAITSFDSLAPADYVLLQKISKLSPGRQYRKRPGASLPMIKWNDKLKPAHHHEQYWFAVENILDHAETLRMFKNDSEFERSRCTESEARSREADALRWACFRTGAYCAHRTDRDADYYFGVPDTKSKNRTEASRISYGESDGFKRAYSAALGAKHHESSQKSAPSPLSLVQHMTKGATVKAKTEHYVAENYRYRANWMMTDESTLLEDFCSVHKALIGRVADLNPYRLRLWLSTVVSGMEEVVASNWIPVLSALISNKKKPTFDIPTTSKTKSFSGSEYSAAQIAELLHAAKTPYQGGASDDDENESRTLFIKNQDEAISSLAETIVATGFANDLSLYRIYLDHQSARASIHELITTCDVNKKWKKYTEDLCLMAKSLKASDAKSAALALELPAIPAEHKSGHITIHTMMRQSPNTFSLSDEWREKYTRTLGSRLNRGKHIVQPTLLSMPAFLRGNATKQHEKNYIDSLDASVRALEIHDCIKGANLDFANVAVTAKNYKAEIEERFKVRLQEASAAVARVAGNNAALARVVKNSDILPHVSLKFFLRQLSFRNSIQLRTVRSAARREAWLQLIKQIATLCRDRQHMNRILRIGSSEGDLFNELQTIDRYSYDDLSFTDAVLLEIDQNVCLRLNQLDIAREMRDPPNGNNAVIQLNMGEGKSSIIIPILSASLAQGTTLVRVFVGRHQSKQMMDTMAAAMGGLMNRSVFCMPYNRDSRLTVKDIAKVKETLVQCEQAGGVLLLQPEHHLSMLLSTSLNEDTNQTKSYVSLLNYLGKKCRDLVDEADEILSPMNELLYTIGTPGPVDFAPDRWLFIQRLLELLKNFANPDSGIVTEDQVLYKKNPKQPNAFPSFSFLESASLCNVLTHVAREFVITGIPGFPVSRYPDSMKRVLFDFIAKREPSPRTMKRIEKLGQAAKSGLALVRGCIAGDVLRVALLRKRWRVDYGCDYRRTPPTRLAVPFAAKDVPKPRAEFSNTDIVIVLTQLSHYHSGLREQDARDLIEHMFSSDDGHAIYPGWFTRESKMPSELRHLKAVNLQDKQQFHDEFFPNIRLSIKAINHFLSRLVFPTELGAFSQHMAASGWDLAKKSLFPKTGFSGTTDLCALLPLDMTHRDLPAQAHTNALVLNNILNSENTVLSMHTELAKRSSDGKDLIDHVISDGRIRVILDVGAQVIKFSNRQVAESWLAQTADQGIKAVLFFDESDVLSVLDHSGFATPLKSSVYARKLDACAVFLDEAHTRGTDLRLPPNYKAAVTLGPGLTKDRLAQGEMKTFHKQT